MGGYDIWPVACGLWPVACGLWPVVCGMWHMICQYVVVVGTCKQRFDTE